MTVSSPANHNCVSVIGLGNVFLGDDGFGPLAVETFRCQYACGPEVEVLDLGTPGLDLAPYLYGRKLVVIVDAVHANGNRRRSLCFAKMISHQAVLACASPDTTQAYGILSSTYV